MSSGATSTFSGPELELLLLLLELLQTSSGAEEALAVAVPASWAGIGSVGTAASGSVWACIVTVCACCAAVWPGPDASLVFCVAGAAACSERGRSCSVLVAAETGGWHAHS